MRPLTILGLLLLVGVEPAWADRQELRLSVAALGTSASTGTRGGSVDALGVGGRIRFSWGWTDVLEFGVNGAVGTSSFVTFRNARVQGLMSDVLADLHVGELALDARLHATPWMSRIFNATQPFIGVRSGMLLRVLESPEARDAIGRTIEDKSATEWSPLTFVAAMGGIQHRFGRSLLVGLLADWTYAGDNYSAFGLALEAGWAWY